MTVLKSNDIKDGNNIIHQTNINNNSNNNNKTNNNKTKTTFWKQK